MSKHILFPADPRIKPSVPVEIDWDNPLAKGLVNSITDPLKESVSNKPLNWVGLPEFKPNYVALDSAFGGDYTDIEFPTGNDDLTIAVRAYPDSTGVDVLLADYSGAGVAFWMGMSGGNWRMSIGGANIDSLSSPTLGDTYTLVATRKSNLWEFWIDGVSQGTLSNSSTMTGTSQRLGRFGASSSFDFAGGVEFFHSWDRALDDHEVRGLTESPYQLLKPALPLAVEIAEEETAQDVIPVPKQFQFPADPKQQPQGKVEVDWSNPITKGLRHSYVFNEKDSPDLASGFSKTYGVGLRRNIVEDGVRLLEVDTNILSWAEIGEQKALDIANDGFTWVVRFKSAFGGSAGATIIGNRYGGTSSPLQFVKVEQNGFQYYNGGTRSDISNTLTANTWYTIVVVKRGNQLEYYEDGVSVGTATVNTTMDANPIFLAGNNTNQESTDGKYEYAHIFERGLTDAEVKSFFDNPYQLFKPVDQWIVGSASTGGGSTEDDLLADDVSSTTEVTSPSVGQEHSLTSTDVSSTSEVDSPSLGQEHGLTSTDIQATSELTSPALSESNILLADDIEVTSEVGSPSIGQTHALLNTSIQALSELTTPVIGQTHDLTITDVESASELTAPTLSSAAFNLFADDIESVSETGTVTIGQTHNMLADDAQSLSELSSPTLGQTHALLSVSIQSTSEVTEPTVFIPSAENLLAEDIESLTEVSAPLLQQRTDFIEGKGAIIVETNGQYYAIKIGQSS